MNLQNSADSDYFDYERIKSYRIKGVMIMDMEIVKSSRHSKIIGDFGENLICNWLSRSGFEVSIVDHTGIDIVAYNPQNNQRLGITVKSRTRTPENENSSVNFFSYQNKKNDRKKVLNACKAFACQPWIGIYVESSNHADLYLTSLNNYDKNYGKEGRAIEDWKMTTKNKIKYNNDKNVKHIQINFKSINWTW